MLAVSCGRKPSPPQEIPTALQDIQQRQGFLRIKLSEHSGGRAYQVFSPGGLRFVNPDGSEPFRYPDRSPVTLSFHPIYSHHNFWRLVLRRFAVNEREKAEALARHYEQELGARTEIIEVPFHRPWSMARRTAGAQLLLTIGRFDNEDDARAIRATIPDITSATLHLDTDHNLAGLINISDRTGRVIGQMMAEGSAQPLDSLYPVSLRKMDGASTQTLRQRGTYRGGIQFFPEEDGSFLPVNVVNIEDYISSVVPGEIGDFAPEEALKAQAVAARSEALCKLAWGTRHLDNRFDFVDGQMDQVYLGVPKEDARCTAAVRATRGEVLLYKNKVIDAVYSHSCGGIRATSEDIWGGIPVPYLKNKVDYSQWPADWNLTRKVDMQRWIASSPCVYCNPDQHGFPEYAKKFFRWQKTVPLEEINRRFNDRGYAIGDLKEIRITKRTASGRVKELQAVGSARTATITNGDSIYVLMGELHSNFFYYEPEMKDGKVVALTFHGAGFGHGVGMCQIGAYMMAKHGWNYQDILYHYFSEVELRKLY